MTTATELNTVFVSMDMLGTEATESDVQAMIAALREKGWDARPGLEGNDLPESVQGYFDRDWQECLREIA